MNSEGVAARVAAAGRVSEPLEGGHNEPVESGNEAVAASSNAGKRMRTDR